MHLGRSAQRVPGAKAALLMQTLRVQQRKPSQQNRIQSITLGVLGVIGPQVG
jgi:hypothetical protein